MRLLPGSSTFRGQTKSMPWVEAGVDLALVVAGVAGVLAGVVGR